MRDDDYEKDERGLPLQFYPEAPASKAGEECMSEASLRDQQMREYAALDDKTLQRWIQGHFEACRHAMQTDLAETAASYARALHRMWQIVDSRATPGAA